MVTRAPNTVIFNLCMKTLGLLEAHSWVSQQRWIRTQIRLQQCFLRVRIVLRRKWHGVLKLVRWLEAKRELPEWSILEENKVSKFRKAGNTNMVWNTLSVESAGKGGEGIQHRSHRTGKLEVSCDQTLGMLLRVTMCYPCVLQLLESIHPSKSLKVKSKLTLAFRIGIKVL